MLVEKCFERSSDKYKYTLCPYKQVKQSDGHTDTVRVALHQLMSSCCSKPCMDRFYWFVYEIDKFLMASKSDLDKIEKEYNDRDPDLAGE